MICHWRYFYPDNICFLPLPMMCHWRYFYPDNICFLPFACLYLHFPCLLFDLIISSCVVIFLGRKWLMVAESATGRVLTFLGTCKIVLLGASVMSWQICAKYLEWYDFVLRISLMPNIPMVFVLFTLHILHSPSRTLLFSLCCPRWLQGQNMLREH